MDSEYINKLAEVKEKTEESIANLQKSKVILDDLTNHRKRVAFHTRLTQHVTLGSSQTVIFDDVITNIGNAYDHLTGLFTAPYDGVYFFASSFLKPGDGPSLHLEMMKNGASISKGHAAAGNNASAIVSLKLGDVIKIRHFEGTSTALKVNHRGTLTTEGSNEYSSLPDD
ncbi:Hypothetical predicted protein [Mytilus galloprovincialis]|uniref:C1q domain-containing protein n=1 Tax=Mytilus galloprovincialis TaxID=29158 RepID=A0A8B6D5S4_MYTGA|nr:Hypothetical predicted protein [Mytilus galloprovincialis]